MIVYRPQSRIGKTLVKRVKATKIAQVIVRVANKNGVMQLTQVSNSSTIPRMAEEEVTHLTHKQKQENRIVEKVYALISGKLKEDKESAVGLTPEELTKFIKFMNSAKLIAASALLTAALGAIYEYLTLVGVTDMSPARVVLVGAWIFGSLFVWEIASTFMANRKRLGWTVIVGVLSFACGLYVLDKWALVWKQNHPPEIAQFTDAVSGLKNTVQQFTQKASTPSVQESVIKEIDPVPGYLKMDWNYPELPLEQPNKAARFNVTFANNGSTYTHDSTMKSLVFLIDFHGVVPPPFHDQKMQDSLKEQLDKLLPSGLNDVAPKAALWSTLETPIITQSMYDALEGGTARIYLAAYAEWKTNKIPDLVNVCLWLQPVSWSRSSAWQGVIYDPKTAKPVWHTC